MVQTVTEPKTKFTLSGTSYTYGELDKYPLQPTGSKKKGYGVQYSYEATKVEREAMFDHLAVVACDVADEKGQFSNEVSAIYKDMEAL